MAMPARGRRDVKVNTERLFTQIAWDFADLRKPLRRKPQKCDNSRVDQDEEPKATKTARGVGPKDRRLSSADTRDVLDTLMALTAMALNVDLPPSVIARATRVLQAYAARAAATAAAEGSDGPT
jgi:hypothetical protein